MLALAKNLVLCYKISEGSKDSHN